MKEVIVKVSDITKIRKFNDNTVIYTKNTCWVCDKDQRIPGNKDVFISLKLAQKGESEQYGKR